MITIENGFPQGPNGLIVPFGSIKLQLNVDATVIAPPGGFVAADIPVVFQFDKNGAVIQPAKIWSNEELDPQNSLGLGTYYLVTFYDQNGAMLNNTPLWWIFPESAGAAVDISQMVAVSTVGGNVIYYPRSIGNAGTVTSVGFVGDGVVLSATPSAPVTTSGNIAATLLTQSANLVLAGPTTGSAATPTFRALVSADLPVAVNIWSALLPATADLTLANTTFNTTFNQTTTVNWKWANIAAATGGANQNSPFLNLAGTYWTGSVSAADIWSIQVVEASGANPQSTLAFTHAGSPGATLVTLPGSLNIASNFTATGSVVATTGNFGFSQRSNYSFPISVAGNASAGLTTYTADFTGVPPPAPGQYVTVAGFIAHTSNNGHFIVSSTSGSGVGASLVLFNAGGTAETQSATGAVDNIYAGSAGFGASFGSNFAFPIAGTTYHPSASFEALPFNPSISICVKGDDIDAAYLRIVNDATTGNHGLEVGAIIDGTGAAPVQLQFGVFGTFTGVTLAQPTLATALANQISNVLSLQSNYWTGSASAPDYHYFQTILQSGLTPNPILGLYHSGFGGSGLGILEVGALISNGNVTVNAELALAAGSTSVSVLAQNSSAATGGANFNSSIWRLVSNIWNGSASVNDLWSIQNIAGAGTNPTTALTFTPGSGTSGVKFVNVVAPLSANTINVSAAAVATTAGQLQIGNAIATLTGAPGSNVTTNSTASPGPASTTAVAGYLKMFLGTQAIWVPYFE